jgi:hypothetical protein
VCVCVCACVCVGVCACVCVCVYVLCACVRVCHQCVYVRARVTSAFAPVFLKRIRAGNAREAILLDLFYLLRAHTHAACLLAALIVRCLCFLSTL